jgi:hypothetical protein
MLRARFTERKEGTFDVRAISLYVVQQIINLIDQDEA